MSTFSGVYDQSGYINGDANTSRYSGPIGMTLYQDKVMLCDSLNYVIRQINTAGQSNILSGTGNSGLLLFNFFIIFFLKILFFIFRNY